MRQTELHLTDKDREWIESYRREAKALLRRVVYHDTPKHASWLNMAEIEIGNLRRQCLARRLPNSDISLPRSTPGNGAEMQASEVSQGRSPGRTRMGK